ncbi:MAG TPA: hypothetical protein VLF87_02465 [Patescibacteria group bacterium]|nr:hypothetical protein [Candidatus Saccharimonadales bacterium]HSX46826.1 hypothetical protein [Patescibacteria group bacterium]
MKVATLAAIGRRLTLVFFAVLLSSIFTLNQLGHKAYAAVNDVSKLCYLPLNNAGYPDAWLDAHFVDRNHIAIKYLPSDRKCVNDGNRTIANIIGEHSYDSVFSAMYADSNTGDSNWNYGKPGDNDMALLHFDPGKINPSGTFGDNLSILDPSQIGAFASGAQIEVSPSKTSLSEFDCANRVSDNSTTSGATYLYLHNVNGTGQWDCTGSSSNLVGNTIPHVSIGNPENFNITMAFVNGSIIPLNDSLKDKYTFTFCQSLGYFQTGSNCTGDYIIRETPDSFKDTNTKKNITIEKAGSAQKEVITIAYGNNPAVQNASGGVAGLGDQNPTCETTTGSVLSWILCPVINGMAKLVDWVFDSVIIPFLDQVPISADPNSSIFKMWSGFRIFGNIALIIALMVIAVAQGVGKE